jgi:hypothetical protein
MTTNRPGFDAAVAADDITSAVIGAPVLVRGGLSAVIFRGADHEWLFKLDRAECCSWLRPAGVGVQSTVRSNARCEGYNRIVKHVGRIAFGFRTPANQRRRVRWACTRQSRQAPPRTSQLRPC